MAAASGAIFDQIILLPVNKNIFKKHIGGEAADFRPKAGSCAFSCNHPRPNMADQNCNLGNDPSSKPMPLTSFKSITA